jgi:H+/Cl- antiporter ClcA
MKQYLNGIIAGLIFGIAEILPMLFMDVNYLPKNMVALFITRFITGLIIYSTKAAMPEWIKGTLYGLIFSLPLSISLGVYLPILGLGIFGGLIIGIFSQRFKHKEKIKVNRHTEENLIT